MGRMEFVVAEIRNKGEVVNKYISKPYSMFLYRRVVVDFCNSLYLLLPMIIIYDYYL